MTKVLLVLLWPAGLIAVIGAGALLARRAPRAAAAGQAARPSPAQVRARGHSLARFPARDVARFLVAVLIGSAMAYAVIDLVGLLIAHAGPTIDRPIWRWTVGHGHRWHVWKSFMGEATQLGYKWTTWGAAATAAVILALVSPSRRWLPPVALGALVIVEHFLTRAVIHAVHRPAPPGSGGTFPSGGTDRVVAIYGLIAYLLWRELSGHRRAAIWAGTVIAAFGFSEAYSRGYLAVHWFTDIVGGVIYGCLLLCVFVASVRLVAGPPVVRRGLHASQRAAPSPLPAAHAGDTTT